MIKKYIISIIAFLIIIMFTLNSTASIFSSNEGIYKKVQQISSVRKIIERISQIISYNDNSVSIGTEDDDLIDSDSPGEDVLLPDIIDVVGEITPDNGNELVIDEDTLEDSPTIDMDGEEGAMLNEEPVIDEDGEIGRTFTRIIEILTEVNGGVGTMLEQIVEHTYASGTIESNGVVENIVDTVVVVGGSGGTAENNVVDNVVVTDNN